MRSFTLRQHRPVARRRRDPAAAAAMALEQAAEGADQQFALAEDIPPLFDRQMHCQEGSDQVAIAEGVAREVGHRLDAEAARPPRSSAARVRYIERYCQRSLQPIQPACGSAGIEDEQGRGRRLLDLATALDHRAALLRHGDDQGVVGVRRIFVGREIGAQQAEAGEVPVPPILRRVPGVAARHVQFLPIPPRVAPLAFGHDRSPLARPGDQWPRPTPISGTSTGTVVPVAEGPGRPSRRLAAAARGRGPRRSSSPLTLWESRDVDPRPLPATTSPRPSSNRRRAPCWPTSTISPATTRWRSRRPRRRAGSTCRRSAPGCRAAPRCAAAGCTWRAGPSATASRS